jgi:hypothetical protein
MRIVLVIGLTALLGGCTYDYLQRTDRVAYSTGDAVRANIERETTNPSHGGQYRTKGLGKSGHVIPADPPGAPVYAYAP